ncbi:MAG: CARDB domain-containing protein [Ferruginibacter sp.]
MKKLYHCIFFVFSALSSLPVLAQAVQITVNPSSSPNIVIGGSTTANYHVSEIIYTDTEIGSSNFTTAATAINHIDFNVFSIATNGISTISNFNLYLKEVPAGTETFATGVYNTTGYTQVFSGTYVAAPIGWAGVDLTTSFVRTSGMNLQLLIERLDNTVHSGYAFRATLGNNNGSALNTSRRVNQAMPAPVPGTTVLNTVSPSRPQIQLKHISPNDAAVTQIYTLGKLPIPYAAPHIISASISNTGSLALTNLNVNLNISGANSFSDIKTIPSLLPGASTVVSFSAFTPAATGNNTVTVSLPVDDLNTDNTLYVNQVVTLNSYNYAYSNTPTGSVGVNGGNTGDFVAKFVTGSPTSVNQVGVFFNTGGQPFKIGIWDKSGAGVPGNLLWESAEQTTTAGLFTLPVSPAVNITDTFYVGVRQIGSTNIQFAYQAEIPIRPNTFFSSVPSGAGTWNDFAPGNPFKFMIEPRLTIANDVGVSTINSPSAAKTVDNCGIIPQATVSNFGSNNQLTPFNVTFIIRQNGAAVYTNTKSVALNSGQSQEVTFAPFSGSASGSDSSYCYTSLATDGATNNDTLVNAFTTGVYSYGEGVTSNGVYPFGNSTTCASVSPYQSTYSWVTQTSNQVNWGVNGDDSVLATAVNLPFSFKYFGINYDKVWIASNGWISFSDPAGLNAATQHTPVTIPLATGIQNYIAALLADS